MIKIENKENCCGCWACENVCPVHCIEMVEDEEGFHYPHVDLERCIECHKCERTCPELKPMLDDTLPIKSFVVQQKDANILRSSTSGGFYSAIAKYVIEKGGAVFGAAFDETMTLRHQCTETFQDCRKFRGSKYVQSLVGETLLQMKSMLQEGRLVVYSGTPCQIAGLYGFLGKQKYENLITVDVVCRGTPSPLLLKKYLAHYSSAYSDKVIDYRSRDKHYGYDYSTATIYFDNTKNQYHKGKESDLMLGLYFKNLISRPSCYQCHFKTINRISDITIFDCWDAPKVSKSFSDKGATNVFIHSEKGLVSFEALKEEFTWAESDTQKQIDADGVMIKHHVPVNPLRGKFFEDMRNMNIPQLAKKYNHKGALERVIAFAKPQLYKLGVFAFYLSVKRKIQKHN